MTTENENIFKVNDSLIEVQTRIKYLTDLVNILQYGFDSVQDDNSNFIVSTLKVIEELLRILESKQTEIIKTLDTI